MLRDGRVRRRGLPKCLTQPTPTEVHMAKARMVAGINRRTMIITCVYDDNCPTLKSFRGKAQLQLVRVKALLAKNLGLQVGVWQARSRSSQAAKPFVSLYMQQHSTTAASSRVSHCSLCAHTTRESRPNESSGSSSFGRLMFHITHDDQHDICEQKKILEGQGFI